MKNKHQFRQTLIRLSVFLFLILGGSGFYTTMATPLNGSYTINSLLPTSGTNFQTFNDFANSINLNGVSGHVVTTVVAGSGPYLEQVVFSNISGAGPNATVTLEGSGELISAITTTTNRHVIRLSNCQYFTVNNLSISRDPASTGGFYGIHIFATGNHITISNCAVDLTGTTSTLFGAYIASGSETSILETGDFHNITITGNYANGGGYGASVFGLVTNLASHIEITNNIFWNAHSNGVYLRETDSAVVAMNFFDKNTPVVTTCNAIQLAQAANINGRIYNNTITVSQTNNGNQGIRGIYLFNGTGHKVYNNVIHNIQLTSGNYTGIEVRSAGTAPEIYFNTISLDNPLPTSGELYGITEELSNTNSILRNNMISITQPTNSIKTGLYLASNSNLSSAFNSNYNNIYVPGGYVAMKGSISAPQYFSTLAAWQMASGHDMTSYSADPVFVSPFMVQPTNGTLDNTGTPITWISFDYTLATRSNPPDIGAYEFSAAPPPPPDGIIGDTAVCENSTAVSYSVLPVTGATSYTWSVTGATLVSGQGSSSIVVDFGISAASISVLAANSTGNSSTISTSISMKSSPSVSLVLNPDVTCWCWYPFLLGGGSPLNGTYSGPGVLNNIFTPSIGLIGNQILTYTFMAANGCSASSSDLLYVHDCTPCFPTGIDEESPAEHFIEISPNPFAGQATVSVPRLNGQANVNLYNQIGMPVKHSEVETSPFILNCEGLPGGIYFLQVTTPAGQRYSSKLVLLSDD